MRNVGKSGKKNPKASCDVDSKSHLCSEERPPHRRRWPQQMLPRSFSLQGNSEMWWRRPQIQMWEERDLASRFDGIKEEPEAGNEKPRTEKETWKTFSPGTVLDVLNSTSHTSVAARLNPKFVHQCSWRRTRSHQGAALYDLTLPVSKYSLSLAQERLERDIALMELKYSGSH